MTDLKGVPGDKEEEIPLRTVECHIIITIKGT